MTNKEKDLVLEACELFKKHWLRKYYYLAMVGKSLVLRDEKETYKSYTFKNMVKFLKETM